MSVERAAKLAAKGRELLDRGDFRGAAKAFASALRYGEAVPLRNNLALAEFMAGEPRRALEVLAPYLEENGTGNPFTYALAARIFCSLQQKEEARRRLQQAVRAFDEGLAELRRGRLGQDPGSFCEYTAVIMRAAADLGEHRYVFDLYRRWEPYHVSWESKFLAGAACFNIGRYKRAAALWASLGHLHRLFLGMQQVALLVERGVIPPFEMGYELHSGEQLARMVAEAPKSEEAGRRCMRDGVLRMAILAWALDETARDAEDAVYGLVRYGEEWGEKLARQLLEHPGLAPSLKLAAANALVARGVLRENEPFEMVIDGERRTVELRSVPVIMEPDEELDEIVNRAVRLRDQGKVDEALALLDGLYREGRFYPPAMMTLANLLRRKGKLEESLRIMEMLEEIDPDNPVLLFNLAALMLQMGETEQAREYCEKIDPRGQGEEFRAKLEYLRSELARAEAFLVSPEEIVRLYEEERRAEVEEKSLPVDASLSRGLRNMPAPWLECACRRCGLEPARLRREREEQLQAFLTVRANLEKVVRELEDEERELLRYLLQRGGWSRLNAVTRKFGSMEGDGFFWHERGPASPLGSLWSRALVVVGRARLGATRCKIAAVPLELREALAEILGMV
ncbi:MAG TPA: hypothetical protein DCL13_03085 [Peptococcaceae bacterium]|nr:hypothetical protein [Peptococcaceae bacterium]